MTNNVSVGYHASHEQFKPSQLLALVQQAEQAGFTHALSSDHFLPWSEAQAESGFAWSWLGAALQATNLEFGVVNAPGQRYHPTIIAQAVATLCEMFPQRFWLAAGSGQLLNEHITGNQWLPKVARNERLQESVTIMRALWAGDTVTQRGHITVQEAKLYTRPNYTPTVIGAAITPETAEWIGSWADGLITISKPTEELQEVVDAFRRGGGEGKPMYLKVQLSYDTTLEKARQGAHEQWKNNIFPSTLLAEVPTPAGFNGIMVAAALSFFAFTGFEDAIKLAEETKHPEKNIPRALFTASGIVILLYLVVVVAAISAVPFEKLAQVKSPLSLITETRYGRSGAIIIAVIALFSTSNSLLSNMLGASRVVYSMAKEKKIRLLAIILEKRQIPFMALILIAVLTGTLSLIGEIKTVGLIANFFVFITFLIVNTAVIYLRIKDKKTKRPFRIPGNISDIPVISVVAILLTLLLAVFAVYGLIQE